jgi:epoxide hydrolase-like predicted phosphatase
MSSSIKAIIFDCFGVILTDALSVIVAELQQTEPDKVGDMRALVHAANRGIIAPEVSTERIAELLGVTVDEYRTRIKEGEVRNQPLLDLIKTLRADYQTAMLSNVTQQGIERRFPNDELAEYFDEVVISSVIGFAKPDAEAYQITAEKLGVEPAACVFIDDRPDFCVAAEQVGMRAITYESYEQHKRELTEVLGRI